MTTYMAIVPSDLVQQSSNTPDDNERPVVSRDIRTVRLFHPRTGIPSLFVLSELPSDAPPSPSSTTQILEIQAVAPPDPRSWFLGEEIISDGKLLIMTPIDPAFLLLPILQPTNSNDGSTGNYLPVDDMFDEASRKFEGPIDGQSCENIILPQDIIRFGSLKCVQDALRYICDVKEITSEIVVYRPSQTKALDYLRAKVARISTSTALDVSKSVIRTLAKDGLMEDGKQDLLEAGRTRAACNLICQYLSPEHRALLAESYDFTELDKYLEDSREAAIVTTVNKERKGKRKVVSNEDKKRKASKDSHGVEKLKRVNVNGMAKLSSFFKKT